MLQYIKDTIKGMYYRYLYYSIFMKKLNNSFIDLCIANNVCDIQQNDRVATTNR